MTGPTSADLLEEVLHRIPYARFLGVRAELFGDELTGVMPFQDKLVGNPLLPALHGGATAAFLEMIAVAQLAVRHPRERLPKPIGVTVEYLRSGKPRPVYARAEIAKAGRRIAAVRVEAWQEARANPIAALHGHFLLADAAD